MKRRIVVLGAGFGGLELSTLLSEALGDRLDLTLIDRNDSFFFGFSKLDIMFGRTTPAAVRHSYRNIEGGHEFYSFVGAERLRAALPTFSSGHAIVGMTSAPFKCPPAPSEAALLLHDQLTTRGVRALDPARRVAILDDASEMPYDLFLGIPKHRVPDVVAASGLTENGWIPVNPRTLETRFPGVYAVGDVTSVGTAKAGTFSEGAARVVAASLLAEMQGGAQPSAYAGAGSCYVEFGEGRVGRVDVDFLSGPAPTGNFIEPSVALVGEKQDFGSSRRARWFGL